MSLMIKQQLRIALLLFLILLIVSCRPDSQNDEMRGRITVWHSWPEENAVVLEKALEQFEEIHPGVRIVSVALPEDRILDEFKNSGNDGLGPALLIGNDSWIGELVNAGLIRSLNPEDSTLPLFNARNRGLTQYQDQIYGMPLSLMPNALYYNKNLVTDPPETLDDLLQEAAAGNQVAFVPRFEKAYWGIQAFGEGLFDADDHFTLAESGFAEWLTWLDVAQGSPGVILNIDDDSLLELFTSGQNCLLCRRS
ncbi:MAG: extracellular solute-binding protein [Anaerolineae bacterium]|nr:extracellular solute-binding protein [Anaerolineae bacterium]